MTTRTATARYEGLGKDGKGSLSTQSGVLKDQFYAFNTRFGEDPGTNPEELIAAAHASCFAMQLAHLLAENGTPAETLYSKAEVELQPAQGGGFEIRGSALTMIGKVPGLEEETFKEIAEKAKEICPVSKALKAIDITLEARFA